LQPHNQVDLVSSHAHDVDRPIASANEVAAELAHPAPSHVPVESTPETGRRLVVFVGIIVVALALGFAARHHHNAATEASLAKLTQVAADAPAEVEVARVSYAPPSHVISFPGEAQAWHQSTIYARVNGYVGTWTADIGQQVKDGQVLATIDTPDLDQQLLAARAKLNATRAGVSVAQAAADFAKKSYDRWWDSPKGVVSEQEREAKKADFDSSIARLGAARAQVNLDAADVKRLEAMEEFKNVTAPFDGTITTRRVDLGDLVTAGSTSSTTSLYDIAQYDTIRVFADVPQSVAAEIRDGMTATAVARELPGEKFAGTVARTSRSIDPAAKTLHVEVDIQNKTLKLLPGMYLEVSFQVSRSVPRLRIPASALTFRSGGPEVAVVGPDGTVAFRPVTIARDMGDSVELGSGVSEGDRVALNISNQIANGDRVTVNDSDNSAPVPAPAKSATAVARGRGITG